MKRKTSNDSCISEEEIVTMNTSSVTGARPFLRCHRGEYAGYDIPVLSTGLLIGRDPEACQLVFVNTPHISRYHCRVFYMKRNGYFVVTDLNSANGVYTEDGNRLEKGGKMLLVPGQVFMLCKDEIIFETVVTTDGE